MYEDSISTHYPKSVRIDTQLTNTVVTVSLAVISVNTTFYICKNRITNEIYTLCMYRVAYHVSYHIASHFYCLVLYMPVGPMYCLRESNSVELQINLFIIYCY